ncbi:PE-PPE domain-containing protein [Gordonia westfalica]|uniref:PE-PPE domain-containing protein n=1 Tax=Gordonia westfalica TaxID=158898 RepID=A0A1H2DR87_9ACTN|nr:PE-PPE domain-containing protein [Gordonia westfalica]SDT84199.1 PE-PPE domain-containing protein [Gordonia westfalica]SDT84882.1 PE-PPE domain-containing protein [Gordonia westfalica]SDT84886.1 PE-PPE domain-containing protein [Gordonia westfalica]SDT85400.1 PE-PPE domain-containing protein [Gordonia westfalica]SDT85435.1 PE-PPE domain-containing protein [Gordonia westfalica]
MIELLWVDGTWAPRGGSPASEALRRALDPRKVKFTYVPYPADFGPATGMGDLSYEESKAIGAAALDRAVTESRELVVVGGYSAGAAVAVKYARDILPRRPRHQVLAVATLGDPHTPVHHGRSGIAGALHVPRPRFTEWAPGDPIADLPLGSPLRTVADLTGWMSVRTPEAARAWAFKTAERLAVAQPWWNPFRWPDFARAGEDIRNYLGTAHSTDYDGGGHAKRLARMIEGVS